ncbi:MAG TPA: GDSL-type esterase/lipase family protein, partial [Leptospiraceae bacterium]|nr:GDSL-type esterase/lipase family protein [Leptospiraceae bacterium]
MKKNVFQFFLAFAITLSLASIVQEEFLDNKEIFPHFKEYLPDTLEVLEKEFKKEPPKLEQVKTNLYAGKDYEYLNSFFEKLSSLERSKDRVIRILHYGDSMLWSDMITSEIRQRFQKDFGDGGRGLVPITNQLSRKVLSHKNKTDETQFTWRNLDHRQFVNPQIGFLGEAAIPNYSFVSMRHEIDSEIPWSNVKLFFRSPLPNSQFKSKVLYKVKQISNTVTLEDIPVKDWEISDSKDCKEMEFVLEDGVSFQLDITGMNSTPIFDSIQFETKAGISYSTVSRQGIEISDLLLIEEKSLTCGFTRYKPDLIVFQFGVNESENLARKAFITPEKYEKDLEDVIRRFQKILPNTNILLISPIERISKNEKGIFQTMPEILFIRDKQKEIAEKNKIAFFDSFTALGGSGQNDVLYENGFMQPDRTHLTRKGGEFFAEIFYSDFFTHYKKFNGIVEETKQASLEKLKKEKNKEVNFVSKAYFYFFLFVWIVSSLLTRYPEYKIGFLAIVSFYFYSTWNFYAVFIILLSTVIDYFCGLQIYKKRQTGKNGSGYLILSLLSNLSLLFFFKYYDFFAGLLNGVLVNGNPIQIPLLHLILPVGISFYTFQTLSYTIDIWR